MSDGQNGVFIDLGRQYVPPDGKWRGEVWQEIIRIEESDMYTGPVYGFRLTRIPPDAYAAATPLTDEELGSLCTDLDDRLQAGTAAFDMVRAMDRINNVRKRADR